MMKTILVTGSTDGIGLEAAKLFAADGHNVILHGRSEHKLSVAQEAVTAVSTGGEIGSHRADFSVMAEVKTFAEAIAAAHPGLDVVINNAGVYRTPEATTADGLDVRFAVNTVAPYILAKELVAQMPSTGRVVNLSSAAQSAVNLAALAGKMSLPVMEAYAQSKLALTMWSRQMAEALGPDGPAIIAINPGSMLGTKMVKEGFGVAGGDIGIGADILKRASISEEFADASGKYFDNDSGRFANPHPDGLDAGKCQAVTDTIESIIARL